MTSSKLRADTVICGAGITGIAAAYFLSLHPATGEILLVDERPALSLTSDKSTECYRNWWPGPDNAMLAFMERSIDLLEIMAEQSANRFQLNRRGYLFASADPANAETFVRESETRTLLGMGDTRVHSLTNHNSYLPTHPSFVDKALRGADIFTHRALVQRYFPYLSPSLSSVIHVRRCGWLSAQQLGSYLLEEMRHRGVRFLRGRVTGVGTSGGGISDIFIERNKETLAVSTPQFVNAAGPMLQSVAQLLGISLPVVCEGHVKITFADTQGAMPRDAPLLISVDPIDLDWTEEEREMLLSDHQTAYLTRSFPSGVHGRPTGSGDQVLLYWTYHREPSEPAFPLNWDPHYPEIVIRGMSTVLPRLKNYFNFLPKSYVDGGYYTKTQENRPLIGPLPMSGAYICGAFSGFGIMASCAAGELLAKYITGEALPEYAQAFALARYEDPSYQSLLSTWSADSGEL